MNQSYLTDYSSKNIYFAIESVKLTVLTVKNIFSADESATDSDLESSLLEKSLQILIFL